MVAKGWARSGKRSRSAQTLFEECWVWYGVRAASWVPFASAEHLATLDRDVAVVVAGLGMVTEFVGALVRRAIAAWGLDVVQEWSWRSERGTAEQQLGSGCLPLPFEVAFWEGTQTVPVTWSAQSLLRG